MSDMAEARHVARRLVEHGDAVDLPPYDEADYGEQNWIDSMLPQARQLIVAFDAIVEYRQMDRTQLVAKMAHVNTPNVAWKDPR